MEGLLYPRLKRGNLSQKAVGNEGDKDNHFLSGCSVNGMEEDKQGEQLGIGT